MRKLVAAVLLLFFILSSNIWAAELCRNRTPSLPDVPDCCRDGFCPHHHHTATSHPPDSKDCTCELSSGDHESLLLALSAPALIPDDAAAPVMHASRFVESRPLMPPSFDMSTPTLPPRA